MSKWIVYGILTVLACCLLTAGCMAEGEGTEMKDGIETIRTDDFSMDYFRFGHGEKTLVILPGLSVESVMKYADSVAEAYSLMADDFTVYVFDRRNELTASYAVDEMARDTAAAIRALGLDQISLFGASQGGMIAMTIAIRFPDLVQKLIIGSSAACMTPARYEGIEKWIQLAAVGNAEDLYLAFGEAIYPQHVFNQYRDVLAGSAKAVTADDLHRFMILAEGMKGFDITDSLQKITCPVLVIGSADDHVLGADAAMEIATGLRTDSGLYMYDGYGHAAYDTAPDYKERIYRFLTEGFTD